MSAVLPAATQDIAELLISKGADVKARSGNGETPLHYAANKEIAEILISQGADVNATGNPCKQSPLHLAAEKGNTGVAEALLAHGVDVNVKDRGCYHETPYECADVQLKEEMKEFLRQHGAKVK